MNKAAVDFIHTQLTDGPVAATTLAERGAEHGWSKDILRRAAKKLGVKYEKYSYRGGWYWRLPAVEQVIWLKGKERTIHPEKNYRVNGRVWTGQELLEAYDRDEL